MNSRAPASALTALLALALWPGCGGSDRPSSNAAQGAPAPAAPEATAASTRPAEGSARKPPSIVGQTRSQDTGSAQPRQDVKQLLGPALAKSDDEPQKQQKEERDYERELSGAVGSLASCVKPRPQDQAPPRVDVTLNAVVIDSGRITRSSASSPQLSREELSCVERRLAGARLPPNVTEAPRNVRTRVTLEFKKPGKQP